VGSTHEPRPYRPPVQGSDPCYAATACHVRGWEPCDAVRTRSACAFPRFRSGGCALRSSRDESAENPSRLSATPTRASRRRLRRSPFPQLFLPRARRPPARVGRVGRATTGANALRRLRRKRRGGNPPRRARRILILSLVTVSHGTKKKDPLKENSSRDHFYIHYGFTISGLSRVKGV
jgi:hypothetical protein